MTVPRFTEPRPDGNLDYRPGDLMEIPARCPECDAPMLPREGRGGIIQIREIDLRTWAKPYGPLTIGGRYQVLHLIAKCPIDPDHYYFPVLMG